MSGKSSPFEGTPQSGPVTRNLKIMYTNADSLVNKMSNLEILCQCQDPDIVAITEVNPKNARLPLRENEIHLNGYTVFTNLTEEGRGVALYIRDSLTVSKFESSVGYRDSVWVDVSVSKSRPLRIGTIYRSPNNSEEMNEALLNHIRRVCIETQNDRDMVIMGDFNCKDIDWELLESSRGDHHIDSKLLELSVECTLTQHVDQPTHVRQGQAMNTLDLVFSRVKNVRLSDIYVDSPLGHSDHVVLGYDIMMDVLDESANNGNPRFLFSKGNYVRIREELSRVDWKIELQGKDTQGQWNEIRTIIHQVQGKYIPRKTMNPSARKNFKPLWMNANALKRVKAKRDSFKRYMRTKDGNDYQAYVNARNAVRREVRRAVKEHEKELSKESKKDPKKFWNYSRRKLKPRPRISKLRVGQEVYEKDEEKARVLNDYFSSVFTNEDETNLPDLDQKDLLYELQELLVTPDMVSKELRDLNPSKSPGPDGMHPFFLKEVAEQLAYPLSILFNQSIGEGDIPREWKEANVVPIHKKGDREDPGNYRPVSLTSVICKVLEALIRDHLLDHLLVNKLISKCQYGFMAGRNSQTNLLDCKEDWGEALDAGLGVDVIYLDLRKAFDTVPHQRLCRKMEQLGVKGSLLTWIGGFLSGRTQKVMVDGAGSPQASVRSGVPQGSVLGPLLFTCYINDITDGIENCIILFADDTKLYRVVRTVEDCNSLQRDLNRLVEWTRRWQLAFNESKCTLLRMGKGHPPYVYTMLKENGEMVQLQVKTEEKDLGVIISSDLKPTEHIREKASAATRALFSVKRSLSFSMSTNGVMLYKAIVRSIIEYANSAWKPLTVKDMEKLEKVQQRATKMICQRSGLNLEYEERLKVLNLWTLTHRRRRGDQIEVFKYFRKPENYNRLVLTRSNETRTRGHSLKLNKIRSETRTGASIFSRRVVNDWNRLPQWVIDAPSLTAFKGRLDKYWNIENVETLLNPKATY